MDDLPVFKKCCFCVPLRYGLLTWGYLKLATALLVLSFFIIIVDALERFIRGDVTLITIVCLVAVILVTEIIIHVVFIIGTHKKIVKLLRAYYYYALFMWIVTIIMSIVATAFIILSMTDHGSDRNLAFALDILGFLFSIVVQTFLVLSLRSEIIKLRSNCPYRFVKNDNEPEGTINSVKDDEEMSIHNGTARIL